MNEKRLEELLRERGQSLAGPALDPERDREVRALVREEAEREGGSARLLLFRSPLVRAAAGLLVLVGIIGILRWDREPDRLDVRIALLEGSATIAGHRDVLNLDPARLPDTARGADSSSAPTEDILAYAEDAEARQAREALDDEVTEEGLDWFRVAFESDVECSAVLVRIDSNGARRDYPREDEAAPGRFAPGTIHVLPQPSVTRARTPEGETFAYDPGFVRPRSQDRIVVLLGLQPAPVDLQELDALLAEASGREGSELESRLREALAQRGFDVRSLTVTRP